MSRRSVFRQVDDYGGIASENERVPIPCIAPGPS